MQTSIKQYLIEKSAVASNRLVANKNFQKNNPPGPENQKLLPVRYLEERQVELYKNFEHKNRVKKSTFHRYVKKSGIFKKPHRLTDLCEYCEKLRSTIKPELRIRLADFGYNHDEIEIEEAKRLLREKREEPPGLIDENLEKVSIYKIY